MKIRELHIQPRASGKTTKLIDDFYKCQAKIKMIICANINIKNRLIDRFGVNLANNIYTLSNFLRDIQTFRSQNYYFEDYFLFIDEYFLFPFQERKQLTQFIDYTGCQFIGYTTSNKLYNKKHIDSIKEWKRNSSHYDIYVDEFEMITRFNEDLFYNLLTSLNVDIISSNSSYQSMMTREQYLTQILGEYITNEQLGKKSS